ncbi:MAG: sugar phosphate nucleotidyltransferase [Patescibacteria group bacterium]
MKVIILCGGRGIRLFDESVYIPKGMVRLGYRPILWHIMKRFALAGHTDFILALGTKGELIRDYFLHYDRYVADTQITLGSEKIEILSKHQEEKWRITFVDTGENSNSGSRIHRCKEYIQDEDFFITYADTLADVDIPRLVQFHKKLNKTLTLTGVIPPYREGEYIVEKNLITGPYDAKKDVAVKRQRYVNGGYMMANTKLMSYLTSFSECRLESEVFTNLIKENQLALFPHHKFWRWLDTDRDYLYLQELVDKNAMYWLQE